MAEHNNTGYWGEQKAAEYLEREGYGIMARDWRCGRRDLDIVAHKDGTVVFVEVKTRSPHSPVPPELSVDREKVRSLTLAAQAFVRSRAIDAPLRFDIVSVVGEYGGECQIDHIKDAFRPL